MSDITKAELIAAFPSGDAVGAWWTAAADFPTSALPNEFFYRTLKAAYRAQITKNQGLSAGSQIDGYNAPAYGTPTFNTTTGLETVVVTTGVQSRVALNDDVAIAPLV